MIAIKGVAEDASKALEGVLREDLLATKSSSSSHVGIADILNRLDKSAIGRRAEKPRRDAARGGQGHQGHALHVRGCRKLSQQARTAVFDQVPIERLVIALKGTEPDFQAAILSSLASRSRRMVEAELQRRRDAVAARARRGAPRHRRHRAQDDPGISKERVASARGYCPDRIVPTARRGVCRGASSFKWPRLIHDRESKTEEPTEKKMGDAREQGNVPYSREAATLASLLGILIVTSFFLVSGVVHLKSSLHRIDRQSGRRGPSRAMPMRRFCSRRSVSMRRDCCCRS